MKNLAVILFAALANSSCSHGAVRDDLVPYRCELPAPTAGQPATFTADAIGQRANSLHIDFEESGADFSSIEVRFTSPEKWAGVVTSIYYQGEAVLNGAPVEVGASIEFQAVPPACLDQPWLFLSDL